MRSFTTLNFLIICICFLFTSPIFTQELSDDGAVHQINFTGVAEDFIIPTDITYDRIEFFLDGGDGGKGSDCSIKGGKGAQITAAFAIAPFGNSLRPGGTIRFIVGERGRNRTGSSASGGAGGGGGTAILYKHPGATTDDVPSTNLTNASFDWVILAVAGGGGGAYQRRGSFGGCGSNSKKGQGGRTGTGGGGFGINPGGTNGTGGTAINGLGGAGGGYLAPGVSQSGLFNNDDGKRGGTQGGEGGYFNFNGAPTILGAGGWGYGGGGAGQAENNGSGGGGGGYSGGGGGLDGNRQGFGGGSFVNNSDIDDFRSIQGDQHIGNPKNGYITYNFFSSNGLIARCKDVTVALDASNTATFFPVDADDGSYTTDESTILNIYAIPADPPGGVASFFNFDCTDLGEHEFVLVVVPSQGSIGYCSFNLTVEDHAPPIALCKNTVAELDDFSVNISPSSVDNGSMDACSSHLLTINKQTFNCLNIGNNIVQLTIRDENDNTATCTATVNVTDIGPPQANCGIFPLTVQLDGSGMYNIQLNQVLIFDSDNCTVTSRSLSKSSFDCSDIGENIVTATVTDQSGNTGTCTASVTVEESMETVALCQDATLALDEQGQAMLEANVVDNGSYHSCNPISLSVNPTSFDCTHIGGQQVTLTASDNNGNHSTCTATVTIIDDILPNAICKDITLKLDEQGEASIQPDDIDGSSYDNCLYSYLDIDLNSFDCLDIGEQHTTLEIYDNNGGMSSCTAVVTVIDDTPPTLICQDITVSLNDQGQFNIQLEDIDGGSYDNCGISNQSFIYIGNQQCPDLLGNPTATIFATDASNNIASCEAAVTVVDDIPPTAICQDITVILDEQGEANLQAEDIASASYDNCSFIFLQMNKTSFSCDEIGSNTVVATVRDLGVNSSTCTATITVVDDTPPVALCKDLTIDLGQSGVQLRNPSAFNNGSYDNCGSITVLNNFPPIIFDCQSIGTSIIDVTVSDGNLTSSCTATATIIDNAPPSAACKSAIVQLDNNGTGNLTPGRVLFISNDACGIQSRTVSPSDFNCDDIGTHTVTVTVTDNNGNSNNCTTSVTVVDHSPPVALCKDLTINLGITGLQLTNRAAFNNGSYDNCGSVTVLNNLFPIVFDCQSVGIRNIPLTVSDGTLTSSCIATATIIDDTPPAVICQPASVQLDDNGIGHLTPEEALPFLHDVCGIQSSTLSQSQFDCDDIGIQTVVVTVMDNNGNSNTCSANVTVETTAAPTAICQPTTIGLDESGMASITPVDVDGGSSGACGISISLSLDKTDFDCNDLGNNTVILTVVDNTGNTANCTANITVEGLPCGWQSDQINCTESAQAGYDPTTGTYNLSAENCYDPNYYSNSEAQSMIQQELCGDGEIIAHVADIDGDAWAGIFMRESNDPGAKTLQLAVSNTGLAQRKLRTTTGGYAFNHLFQNQGKFWLRITRSGNQFGAFLSSDGSNWDPVLITNIPMTNCIQAGLFLSNTTPGTMATASFDQVQIMSPAGNALQSPNFQLPISQSQVQPDFSVYPNPTNGDLTIVLDAFMDQSLQIQVYNQQGQLVLTKALNGRHALTENLHLQHLQDGLYFIQLKTKDDAITKKIYLAR